MKFKKWNNVKRKSFHYNKGIWSRLVHHHNKSCVKGEENCKLKRLKNKCNDLKRKKSLGKPIELIVTKKINLNKPGLNSVPGVSPINFEEKREESDKKIDEILNLINTSSSIKTGQFGPKDRLYDSKGEINLRTYTCPSRNFDTLDQLPFQTVVKKIESEKLNEKNTLNMFVKLEYNDHQNSRNSSAASKNFKRNNYCQGKKLVPNSNVKNINKIRSRNENTHGVNKKRFFPPSTPPQLPIQGSTKAWELLEGYEKHCQKKQKETTWDDFKENTETDSHYPYFL